jgi:hypothetical protein
MEKSSWEEQFGKMTYVIVHATQFYGFLLRSYRIRWADRNSESPDLKANLVQVHVTFTSPLSLPKVTEEVLNIIFSPYGEVADCVVRRCVCDQSSETQNGYGFVYYHSVEVARTAVDAIQKTTINGVFFDCDISHRSGHTNNSAKGPVPQLVIQPGIYSPITRQNYRPNHAPENQKLSPTAVSPFLRTGHSVRSPRDTFHPNSQKEGHVDTAALIVASDPRVIHQGGFSFVPMGAMVPKGVWYPSEVHHISMGTPGYHHHATSSVGVPSHSASFTLATDTSRNAFVHYGTPSLQSVQGGPSHGIPGDTQCIPAQYVANYGAVSQAMHGVQYQHAMPVPPYPQHSLSMPSSPVTPEYLQYPGYGFPQMIPAHYAYSSVYHTGEVPVPRQMQVAYVPDQHGLDPNRPVGK